MSQFFASGGQSIGVSASKSVLPMNTQDWSPLGWTGWISLWFKGLSRVFPTPQFKSINSFWLISLCIMGSSFIHLTRTDSNEFFLMAEYSPGWMHETSAQTWCTGKTQWDRAEREVGGGIGMGNTCISKADSCQCMTKTTTIL